MNYYSVNFTGFLRLKLHNNPFTCDERMQWIKDGEANGWLRVAGVWGSKIFCENFPGVDWDDVHLPKYNSRY